MWRLEILQPFKSKIRNHSLSLEASRSIRWRVFLFGRVLAAILVFTGVVYPQAGMHILYGDVKVDDSKVGGNSGPMAFHIILYAIHGTVIDRQVVPNNGRYRFSAVRNGEYDVGIELDGVDLGRVRVIIQSVLKTDIRQDIELELKPGFKSVSKGSVVSADDIYERGPATRSLFQTADRELTTKNFEEALRMLKRIVEIDPKDFQAWTQLGTVHLGQKQFDEADNAYSKAIAIRPSFFLALLNLGRLRLMTKKYEAAIEPLTQALVQRKDSADANFYLGETYLQLKKGNLGAQHLYEALRLDPVGQAEAHLRLATLYNAVGMKDKAAIEYQEFLKKQPSYADRKKLEKYIEENQTKKP
jgi:Tfp pilus assembly protein PilF